MLELYIILQLSLENISEKKVALIPLFLLCLNKYGQVILSSPSMKCLTDISFIIKLIRKDELLRQKLPVLKDCAVMNEIEDLASLINFALNSN